MKKLFPLGVLFGACAMLTMASVMYVSEVKLQSISSPELADTIIASGVLVHDTSNERIYLGDGSTTGGVRVANYSDVTGRIGTNHTGQVTIDSANAWTNTYGGKLGKGALIWQDSAGTASGFASHADSIGTASGSWSHADSSGTASGNGSHADSSGTASVNGSHADSYGTASGNWSHADSYGTASGNGSHANTAGIASGNGSVASIYGIASNNYSRAIGRGAFTTEQDQYAACFTNGYKFAGGPATFSGAVTSATVVATGSITAPAFVSTQTDPASSNLVTRSAGDDRWFNWRTPFRGTMVSSAFSAIDGSGVSDLFVKIATNNYSGCYLHCDYAPTGFTNMVINGIYTTANSESNAIHEIQFFPFGRKGDGTTTGYGTGSGTTIYITNNTSAALSGSFEAKFAVPWLQATNGAHQIFLRRGAGSTGDFGPLNVFSVKYKYE